jgi:hypothetical protein
VAVLSIVDWVKLANNKEVVKIKSTQVWKSMDVQNTNFNPNDPYSKPKNIVNGNGSNATGFNATPIQACLFGVGVANPNKRLFTGPLLNPMSLMPKPENYGGLTTTFLSKTPANQMAIWSDV